MEVEEASSPFVEISANIGITLPPCYVGSINVGVEKYLSAMIMRYEFGSDVTCCTHSNHSYDYGLQGVPVSFRKWRLRTGAGYESFISSYSGDISVWVKAKFVVFRPTVGARLGKM